MRATDCPTMDRNQAELIGTSHQQGDELKTITLCPDDGGAKITPHPAGVLRPAKETFHRWLELPDDRVLDFVYGVYFANRLGGDPVWGGIVGASGDTKTEVLRSLQKTDIYHLTSVTPNTLISGLPAEMARGEEPSLLPKLDGKVLVVKDLTPLITGHPETRMAVLGQLRDAYDGFSGKAFGTGELKQFKSKFGFLFAVTPVIETCWPVINQLGERFVYYRCPKGDSLAKVRAAAANSNQKDQMRAELASASKMVLELPVPDEVPLSTEVEEQLVSLADLIAVARTPVKRAGRTDEIEYLPSPEVGTRLVGQFIQLARGIAIVRQQPQVDESVMDLIRHVARSGIQHRRLALLKELFGESDPVPTVGLGQQLCLPSDTVKRVAEDLWVLGLVKRGVDGRAHTWTLSDLGRNRISQSKLFGDVA